MSNSIWQQHGAEGSWVTRPPPAELAAMTFRTAIPIAALEGDLGLSGGACSMAMKCGT